MIRRAAWLALWAALGVLLAAWISGAGWRAPGTACSANAAARHSSALAISGDGGLLAVANPDSNTVSLVDTASQQVLAEISVGIDPRTLSLDDASGRLYVANRASHQVTVIDSGTHQVLAHIPVGAYPYGVLVSPDGARVYVSEQGSARLAVIDAASLQVIETIALDERPSGLAISADGRSLYVTHLLSGKVSLIQRLPLHIYLPLAFNPGSARLGTAAVHSRLPAALVGGREHFLVKVIAMWPDSNLAQAIVISNDGARAYLPHTRSNTANQALTFDTTVTPLVSLLDLVTNEHLLGQQIDLATLDPPGVGLPFDAALTPDGQELWVVNAASNDLSVVGLNPVSLKAHIQVADNPRAIVFSPDGSTAYVNNTLAGTVSVVDAATYQVSAHLAVTTIPLPPLLLQGKRLFHSSDDPRMSNAQWIACNTCHFEGEHDGRTWFFAFAGPRSTTSLLGMIETYPLRWSGEWDESADSEFANLKENFGAGLLGGALNCTLFPPDCVSQPPNQGLSPDLDALAAFIDSLAVKLSPGHVRGEPLSAAEARGRDLYLEPSLGCITCHPPPHYTDHLSHDVGTATLDEKIGPAYDTPSLRGLFDSAPYFHDGSALTLFDALTRPSLGNEHNLQGVLTLEQIWDLIAYLSALPYE